MCKHIDFIAPKVEFTYKQKKRHGSLLGGCISLMFIFALLAIGLLFLISMMMAPNYTTNVETKYLDTTIGQVI